MLQRILSIVVILVIVLGGGMYLYNQLMPSEVATEEQIVYATKEVTKGDISVGVEIQGILDSSRGSALRVPGERRYDGGSTQFKINEILVEEGDEVKKDQLLVVLDSTDIKNEIKKKQNELNQKIDALADMTGIPESQVLGINIAKGITVRAPLDGKIVDLDSSQGQEIDLGHIIGRVVDDSKFIGEIKIAPTDYESIKVGEEINLTFEEFSQPYKAIVKKLNPHPVLNVPDKGDGEYAKGFVHKGEVEGVNPGLVQTGMEFACSKVTEQGTRFYGYNGKIKGYFKEKKIINTIKAVVTEVHVMNMENVKKGDPIITMASDDIQDTIEEKLNDIRDLSDVIDDLHVKLGQLEVKAPANGVVAYINGEVGESVNSGQWMGSIFNVESMQLWGEVDDIDVLNVKVEANVRVTVDAVPGKTFEGKVENIDTRGDRGDNGITKYSVYIDVIGSGQLKPNMQAKGLIEGGSAEGVLLVPMEAVFEEEGQTMVEILDNNVPKLVTVKLGLMNDRYAEVKSGLEEGQLVVTGSNADLLPSQHIGSKDSLLPSKGDKEDGEKDKKSKDE